MLSFNVMFPGVSKLQAHFQSMEVRNSHFAAFIDVFTSNTYVMVVTSDSALRKTINFPPFMMKVKAVMMVLYL